METLPALTPSHWLLIIEPRQRLSLLTHWAVQLAPRDGGRLLIAGNRLDLYTIARSVRRVTPRLYAALERLQIVRAFTATQVVASLQAQPAVGPPLLVFDLLSTFADESLKLGERHRLLQASLAEIVRISRQAPLAVGVRPPSKQQAELQPLLSELRATADEVWEFAPSPALHSQLPLF